MNQNSNIAIAISCILIFSSQFENAFANQYSSRPQDLSKKELIEILSGYSLLENDTPIEVDSLIKEFKVTEKVMKKTKSDSIFMHCLPANRNDEVEASVIDGNNSRVWQEASNRLFVQKEILKVLF